MLCKSVRIFGLLAALVVAGQTYGSHRFPEYPARGAAEYSIKVVKPGLIVAVEPLDDSDQQKLYFNVKLDAKGMLAVFLVIENTSGTDTYLFDKSAAGLAEPSAGSGSLQPVGSGGLVELSMIKDASNERENMLKKEVRSQTLAPHSSLHGFLYVPVPHAAQRGKIHLQIPLTNSQSGEIEMVNLTF